MPVLHPLAAGLLTGKHDFSKPPADGRFKGNQMYMDRFWKKEYFEALQGISEACATANMSMVDAALGWLKHHSMLRADCGDGIIIGASSMGHLQANLDTVLGIGPLPEEVVAAFESGWTTCKEMCPKYFRP